MQDFKLKNDKVKMKLVMEMLKQIERVSFETKVGKELHEELVICITGVIRPAIIKKGHELINL